MSSSDWALSIDFGTSNTAAAHINPVQGNIEAISLSNDRRSMPSSVYVDSPDDITAGAIALSKAQANPNGFIPSPKRVVGQPAVSIKGYDVEPSALVAAVYAQALERAMRHHNDTKPSKLILTHPEAWSEGEVQVLIDAAAQAGIPREAITTISEPKAAAAYYTRGEELAAGDKIAVFDIGGGTVDIAVLEAMDGGGFTVLAAGGNNTIGGKSFDATIRRWVDQELEQVNPELLDYLRNGAKLHEIHALENAIRGAKELLSETASADITIHAGLHTERLVLTRTELENLIKVPLDRAKQATERTFHTAGITSPDNIKALYLTGGTSRVPALQETLKPLAPLATLDDPKTVVAQGGLAALEPSETPQHTAVPLATAGQDEQSLEPALRKTSGPHDKGKLESPKQALKTAQSIATGSATTTIKPEPGSDAEKKPRWAARETWLAIIPLIVILSIIIVGSIVEGNSRREAQEREQAIQAEAIAEENKWRAKLTGYPSSLLDTLNLAECYEGDDESEIVCPPPASVQSNHGLIVFETAVDLSIYPWRQLNDHMEAILDPGGSGTASDPFTTTEVIHLDNPAYPLQITTIDEDGAVYFFDRLTQCGMRTHAPRDSVTAQVWATEAGLL